MIPPLDTDLTCRLCLSALDKETNSIQPYIGTLCRLGEFSLDDRLPQKMCQECLVQLKNVESVRLRMAEKESLWSTYLVTNKESQSAPVLQLHEIKVETAWEGIEDPQDPSSVPLELDPRVKLERIDEDERMEDDCEEESADPDYMPSSQSEDEAVEDEAVEDAPAEEVPLGKENMKRKRKLEGPRDFPCPFCTYAARNRYSLRPHIKSQHAGRLVCMRCISPFSTAAKLSAHEAICAKSVKCAVCNAQCANGKEYKKHLNTVHDKEAFVCDFPGCDKVCNTGQCLRSHKTVHTAVKRFKCTYEGCDAIYRRKYHLQLHERFKHTGEKPFGCQHCDRMFSSTAHRLDHQRMCKALK